DWTQTTNTIDYGIKEVTGDGSNTTIVLERIGLMPMPQDILLVYEDASREAFYTPLRMMRGEKGNPYLGIQRPVLPEWPWAMPTFEFTINKPLSSIRAVLLDPSQLMADVNPENNLWQQP
ncbi:MAG: M1 family peptidase, partial [Eudoraea sp.]|nr:M1 family peptidase [Eudoraea sp.]NNJ41263.1 M1 family peptidase [Eudoraea sp.]